MVDDKSMNTHKPSSQLSTSDFLRQLSFQDLQLLQSIWQFRSLTSAAEQVGMSIAASSRRLAALRVHFNDELFVRSAHEMLPTTRMRSLLANIETILKTAEILSNVDTPFNLETETRKIRIVSTDNLVPAFLTLMLKHFYKQAPRASMSVCNVDERLLERMRMGQADMAILASMMSFPSDFNTLELYQSEFAVMVKGDHPLVQKEKMHGELSRSMIEEYRAVRVVTPDSPVQIPLPLELESGFETPYFLSIPDVLRQTEFIFVGPAITLHWLHETYDPSLRVLKAPRDFGKLVTQLVWHQSTHSEPFYQWARGLLTHVSRMEAKRHSGYISIDSDTP